jgi:uncharacterized protein YkwD
LPDWLKSPIRLVLAVALMVVASCGIATAQSSYRVFADRLVANLPDGMSLRPDLEAYLNERAAAARQGAGRTAVVARPELLTAARAQALEMAIGNYVGHQSSTGEPFRKRFEAFLDDGTVTAFGENAARDRQKGAVDRAKASRLFQQWLDSAGHRRNLINPDYQYVATGAVQKGNHLYAVQIFWNRDAAKATQPGQPTFY